MREQQARDGDFSLSPINVLIDLKATVLFEPALFIIDQLSLDIVTLRGILLEGAFEPFLQASIVNA
jgi:hypothetical protein